MKYETEGCSLEVPEVITVKQQLQYTGSISFSSDRDRIIKWWEAGKHLIEKWECEEIQDYKDFDIEESSNPEHARIIAWAASTIWQHMVTLKEVPKK